MKDGKVTIDVEELVAQVRFLAEAAKNGEQAKHRIVKVVAEMRRYKAVVVKANVPRDRELGGHERLRAYREGFRDPGGDRVGTSSG